MGAFLNACAILLPLGYLVVALDYGALFFLGRSLRKGSPSVGLWLTVALHAAYLAGLTMAFRQLPAASISQALSFVAFSIVIVYAIVERHSGETSTGLWLVSPAFGFSLLSSLLAGPPPTDSVLFSNRIFATHVSLALLGYAAFAVAASYGFLYLRLYKDLKEPGFSSFFGKLPPLEVLERMMSSALLVGFLALTFAVGIGLSFAREVAPDASYNDPKIIATVAVWLLYGGAIVLRRLQRWQGRQVAIASLTGLAAVLFSLFAVNIWSDFHTFL